MPSLPCINPMVLVINRLVLVLCLAWHLCSADTLVDDIVSSNSLPAGGFGGKACPCSVVVSDRLLEYDSFRRFEVLVYFWCFKCFRTLDNSLGSTRIYLHSVVYSLEFLKASAANNYLNIGTTVPVLGTILTTG